MQQKFIIPEEIPANERTAFHGAAAAAAKAGKSHFNFNGKKHPVTMNKDTAHKIADQKEEPKNKGIEAMKKAGNAKADAEAGERKKTNEDKEAEVDPVQKKEMLSKAKTLGKKKAGETASVNPKLDSGKDSKDQSMEQKESTIRQKLMAVLEAENHSPNKNKAEKPEDALKGDGAKKMAADAKGDTVDIEKQSHDDAAKAGRAGPGRKARSNDNMKGDSKIINQPVDATKGGKGEAMVKSESYDTMSGLKEAYATVAGAFTIELEDLDESMLGHGDAEKLNGGKSKDSNFKSPESHIDYHHRQSGGHNKSGGDQDRHRYQVAKKLGYDV